MATNCYNHPQHDAIGTCRYCGRSLCADCLATGTGYYYCRNEDDCLTFQEKESDASSLKVKKEPAPPKPLDQKKEEPAPPKKADLPVEPDRGPAKEKGEDYYQKLFRRPGSLRDAVVMAEVLTRPRFRKR